MTFERPYNGDNTRELMELAGALHASDPTRNIYLVGEDVSGASATDVRANAARNHAKTVGICGIVSYARAKKMLESLEASSTTSTADVWRRAFDEASSSAEPANGGSVDAGHGSAEPVAPYASDEADDMEALYADAECEAVPDMSIAEELDAMRILYGEQDMPITPLENPPSVPQVPPRATHPMVQLDKPAVPHETAVPHEAVAASEMVVTNDMLSQQYTSKVITFMSGRGGVGKSTISLLCAVALWQSGARVALVDFDVQFGDIEYLLGQEPAMRIRRVDFENLIGRADAPCLSSDELLFVNAAGRPERAEEFAKHVPAALNALSGSADIIVINTGSFWSDVHAVLAARSDTLLLTMDQRATSVKACKQAVELCARMQVPNTKIRYVLNRCSKRSAITDIDASMALGGADVVPFSDGGDSVDELLSLGCPIELISSNKAVSASLGNLLDAIAPACPHAAAPPATYGRGYAQRADDKAAKRGGARQSGAKRGRSIVPVRRREGSRQTGKPRV
ncbi:MAG: P-loop NTPase [Coriobacteriales bacterium]|jgi:Flp pilus assembly CpaE family ATPase|nr:P-loop NTPase [Coriobacteriales bacterium]